MNIVEVNYTDLSGRIFNGYDLHLSLNKMEGVSAVQYVAEKESGTPTVKAFRDDAVIREEYLELERSFSIGQLLSPYGVQLLKEEAFLDADIIHLHIIHNNCISLLDLPELLKRDNVVWTIHDPWIVTGNCVYPLECGRWKMGCGYCPRLNEAGRRLRVDTTSQLWNLKKSIFTQINPHIITASGFTEKYLAESPLTAHWNRLTRIPFGIKKRFLEPFCQSEDKRRFGLAPDCLVIGFRLTDYEIKGCRYIFEALEQLNAARPIALLTTGDSKVLPDSLREKYQCVTLPWLQEDDLIEFYRALDIFLMTSLAETFGLMAAESMACETALICFQSTVLEEITHAPDIGIAAAYRSTEAIAEALTRLVEKPEELADRKRRGKRFVAETYNYDRYVQQHLQLFREIAAHREGMYTK